MGVDTGKKLHVVILRRSRRGKQLVTLIDLRICSTFEDLDDLMERYQIWKCVIDGLPETHATRDFARRHRRKVYLCFFNESQRGSARWDRKDQKVEINRTEALDMSRAVIREKGAILSRGLPLLQEFARHMSCDAKRLDENPDTGEKKYRYVRTGENHFSMAFTYACMAYSKMRIPSVVG